MEGLQTKERDLESGQIVSHCILMIREVCGIKRPSRNLPLSTNLDPYSVLGMTQQGHVHCVDSDYLQAWERDVFKTFCRKSGRPQPVGKITY